MANIFSDILTNRDATPRVPVNSSGNGAEVQEKVAYVAKGAETDGSTWRFFDIPSNAIIGGLFYQNSAIAGFTSIKIGLYDTTKNGGAVVSAGLFGTALDLHLGQTVWTDATTLVTTLDIIEKRVWELLGLASDPGKSYDVAMTGTTAGTNTGKLALKVQYKV